jgi:oxygen-independent coproporphyrinogen-3 oxidase
MSLSRAGSRDPAAIYVHWAFCPYICPYCDFAKWPFDERAAERYVSALEAEIARAPELAATTVFYGGGTPNANSGPQLVRVLDLVRERFGVRADAEISIEVNPDRELTGNFDLLRESGFNRMSIGVQSFEAPELRVLGRRHSAADVLETVRRARAAGFGNLNVDLMFGVPGQTLESWERSLDAAIALGIEHISTYGLTIEEGTPYAGWQAREPAAFADDEREAQMYALAIAKLTAAGFEHYEISNFAKPSFRCEHNANYWRNGAYLGVGAGAASYLGGVRSTHTRDRAAYEAAALAGEAIPGDSEELSGDARTGEAIMLALRTSEGVDAGTFRERYGVDVFAHYAPIIADYAAAGLLVTDDRSVRLTTRGRFVANDVCGAFLART